MRLYLAYLVLLMALAGPVAFIITFIVKLFHIPKISRQIYPGVNALIEAREEEIKENIQQEQEKVEPEAFEEVRFCQLFKIGPNMFLLIDHIEMCPDETAFIRVVDDEGYTPLYKRKVRRDKNGNRYILFNSTNHYLDDKKTQPVITK